MNDDDDDDDDDRDYDNYVSHEMVMDDHNGDDDDEDGSHGDGGEQHASHNADSPYRKHPP